MSHKEQPAQVRPNLKSVANHFLGKTGTVQCKVYYSRKQETIELVQRLPVELAKNTNFKIKFQILDHISVRKRRVNEINCNVNIILS